MKHITLFLSTSTVVATALLISGCGRPQNGDSAITVSLSPSVSFGMIPLPNGRWIGKHEVTQALWETVMANNPSEFKGENNPVENVSWDDCQEFLKKLNALPTVKKTHLAFRLPKDDEWESACRGGSNGTYCKLEDGTNITEENLGSIAWVGDNSNKMTHPVGEKHPNAFGLHDMLGNVWEWTQTADGGKDHIICGGSWNSTSKGATASYRISFPPSIRLSNVGFRLIAEKR